MTDPITDDELGLLREAMAKWPGYSSVFLLRKTDRWTTVGDSDLRALIARLDAAEAERDRLRGLVRELAEELESELLGRYDAANGVHPALVRKFDLEMEPVKRAWEALGDD